SLVVCALNSVHTWCTKPPQPLEIGSMAISTLTLGYSLLKRSTACLIDASWASPPKACRRRLPAWSSATARPAPAIAASAVANRVPVSFRSIASSLSRPRPVAAIVKSAATGVAIAVDTATAIDLPATVALETFRFVSKIFSEQIRNVSTIAGWTETASEESGGNHSGCGEAGGRRNLDRVGGDQPLGAGQRRCHRPR